MLEPVSAIRVPCAKPIGGHRRLVSTTDGGVLAAR